MHLLDIKAENLMGRSFHHGLARVNLIIGRNDTGKTAILNAIRLLFTDKLVDQRGKQIRAMVLSSGPTISVEANTDNGDTITRSWGKKKDTQGVIDLPPVLLDSRVYFNLSAGERTKFVFERFAGDIGTTKDEILASIQSEPMEYPSAETEVALRSILSDLRTSPSEIQPFLDGSLVQVDLSLKAYKETSSRMAATIAGLTQLDAQYATAPTNVHEIKDAVAVLRKTQADLSEKIGGLKKTVADYAKKMTTRDALVKQLAEIPDHSEAIKTLAGSITTEEPKLLKTPAVTREIGDVLSKAQMDLLRRENEHDACVSSISTLQERKNEIESTGACPYCKHPGTDALAEMDKEIALYETKRAAFKLTLVRLHSLVNAANKTLKDAEKQDSENATRFAAVQKWKREREILILQMEQRPLIKTQLTALGDLTPPDTTALIKLESGYVTDAQKLDQDLVLAGNAANHKLRMLQSQKEKATADAGLRVATMIQDKLTDARDSMVKKVIEGLIAKTDPFLKDIVNFKLAFKDGDIGCYRGANWVPHDLFSGIQQKLTYAALSVALASDTPFKLVIIDEVTILDSINKALFLAKMCRAVHEGLVDQVFLCDTSLEPYKARISEHPMDVVAIISTDPKES